MARKDDFDELLSRIEPYMKQGGHIDHKKIIKLMETTAEHLGFSPKTLAAYLTNNARFCERLKKGKCSIEMMYVFRDRMIAFKAMQDMKRR